MAPAATTGKLAATGLGFDTSQAAAGNAGDGLGYIGVWAADAAGCLKVDQPGATGFAVITTATVRTGDSACYKNNQPLADGKLTINATCAGGAKETVEIAMSTPDSITLNGTPLIRCVP